MITDAAAIVDLLQTTRALQDQPDLERGLQHLARMAAERLGTRRCSVMLLREASDGAQRLHVFASLGNLPAAARKHATPLHEGIAGHVATTGKPLLVTDIGRSEFAAFARYPGAPHKGLVSAPIAIDGRVIGVINLSDPIDDRAFDDQDLLLTELLGLFVGKSIHVIQLQGMLESRFVQLTAACDLAAGEAVRPLAPDPAGLSKTVAHGIYRELRKAGFGPNQVIAVAAEVISELRANLGGDSLTGEEPARTLARDIS